MKNNIPLNDTDRLPWLKTLSNKIIDWNKNGEAILACSALKEKYREVLASKTKDILWVFLDGPFELILSRIKNRKMHFMPESLLRSQFDALEIPGYGLHINIELTPDEIADKIKSKIKV
jgi:carbohydrate kinase (thermoresistant glucokinase family)